MAYYTALIAAWNSSTQPPAGVNGTGLSSSQTTTQKLDNINGWTVTGSVPTSFYTDTASVANCIQWSEFASLTLAQQQNLLALLQIPGPLLGGSGQTSRIVPGMIISCFPSSSVTIANLTNLSKAATQSWAQANGYPYNSSNTGNINEGDLAAAGLS